MPIFRLLREACSFPDPSLAEPNGLLAVGGDLSPDRLLAAYTRGIFPWYSPPDPLLWWSPSPRLLLFPPSFHLPKRLRRTIASRRFTLSADTAFAEVMAGCATASGRDTKGTWITTEMQQAYLRLHKLGFAHSIECWFEGQLVGGLYGVCLDAVFFGESMFTRKRDASKVALSALVKQALQCGIALIDCQMTTEHLLSFGAEEVDRTHFQALLTTHIRHCLPQEPWQL